MFAALVGCGPTVVVEESEPVAETIPPVSIPEPEESVVEYCEVGMYHRKCRRFDDSVGLCTVPGLCALPCENESICKEIVDCHIPKCEDGTCAYYMTENGSECATGVCLNGACQSQ